MNQKRQQELINQLAEICEELDWDIAIPGTPESTQVDGLVIGKDKFVETVLQSLNDSGHINLDSTEVFSVDETSGDIVEANPENIKVKKNTFH